MDHITMGTSGSTVRQSTETTRTEVTAPPLRAKAVLPEETKTVPQEKKSWLKKGLAKASPSFKKVDPDELTEEQKDKAIAENTVEHKEDDNQSTDDE
jgi:hypothetical protein